MEGVGDAARTGTCILKQVSSVSWWSLACYQSIRGGEGVVGVEERAARTVEDVGSPSSVS